MRGSRGFAALLASLSFVLAALGQSPQPTWTITGVAEGRPMPQKLLIVRLDAQDLPDTTVPLTEVRLSPDGSFTAELPAGKYVITYHPPCYSVSDFVLVERAPAVQLALAWEPENWRRMLGGAATAMAPLLSGAKLRSGGRGVPLPGALQPQGAGGNTDAALLSGLLGPDVLKAGGSGTQTTGSSGGRLSGYSGVPTTTYPAYSGMPSTSNSISVYRPPTVAQTWSSLPGAGIGSALSGFDWTSTSKFGTLPSGLISGTGLTSSFGSLMGVTSPWNSALSGSASGLPKSFSTPMNFSSGLSSSLARSLASSSFSTYSTLMSSYKPLPIYTLPSTSWKTGIPTSSIYTSPALINPRLTMPTMPTFPTTTVGSPFGKPKGVLLDARLYCGPERNQ